MIKTHKNTGLKYLCKRITTSDSKAISYKGSGKYWKLHLKVHGKNIITEILLKYDLNKIDAFSKKCIEYSNIFNIVQSDEWANLIEENGLTGAIYGDLNPSKRIDVNIKKSNSLKKYYSCHPGFFAGKKHSDETKLKMSQANKGDNNVMRRRKDSLQKMIETKNTPEYKEAVRMRSIEINSRPDVKEKIRQSKLGDKNSSKRPEVREKIKRSINAPKMLHHLREINSGSKNPRADKIIYSVKNQLFGYILIGTKYDIEKQSIILNKENPNVKILKFKKFQEFLRKNRNAKMVKGWIKL